MICVSHPQCFCHTPLQISTAAPSLFIILHLMWFCYPWFEGGQSQSDPDRGLVGVHHRVVVDVAVVAHSDRLVVVLVDAVESVDWF